MTTYKVVVDGSNIATEGRTMPSLVQLDEAVRSFIEEHPGADVLVIVDSTFPNRIDRSEQPVFEAAYMAGEIITPPAGTVGRGDAFILKVADKLGATIFSNDSFQEFHGIYDWLFAKDRLMGGKPIPGLGWVFTPRVPVRGPRSREAVRDSKRGQVRIGSPEALKPMPVPKAPPPVLVRKASERPLDEIIAEVAATPDPREARDPRDGRGSRDGRDRDGRKKKRRGRGGERADDSGTRDRLDPITPGAVSAADNDDSAAGKKRRKRRKGGRGEAEGTVTNGSGSGLGVSSSSLEAVNPSLTFINFIAAHGIGSEVTGVVERYSSHGMYVDIDGALGYVPLSGLAEPMPRSAKEVIRKGETARWIVKSFDSTRRGIEVALVGSPSASTIEPETVKPAAGRGRVSKKAAAAAADAASAASMAVAAPERAARRSGGRKAAASALQPSALQPSAVVPPSRKAAPKKLPAPVALPLESVSDVAATTQPRKNPARKVGVRTIRTITDAVSRGAKAVGKGAGGTAKAVDRPAKTPAKASVRPAKASGRPAKVPASLAPAPTVKRAVKATTKATKAKVPARVTPSKRVAAAKPTLELPARPTKSASTKTAANAAPATSKAATKAAASKAAASSKKAAPVAEKAAPKAEKAARPVKKAAPVARTAATPVKKPTAKVLPAKSRGATATATAAKAAGASKARPAAKKR